MKTNILVLAVLTIGALTTSCRKERSCECKTTRTEVISGFGAQTNISNTSSTVTMEKQKKNQFKYSQSCFSTRSTEHDSGGNGNGAWTSETVIERNCELN